MVRKCVHCDTRLVTRPRGLCMRCYMTPGVRERYPTAVARSNRRGVGNGHRRGDPPAPPEPTPHGPGTPGKVDAMAGRAAAGHSLWHRGDARG